MRRSVATRVVLLALFAVFPASRSLADNPPQKPLNVLLIISDDLSAEALGCYGNQQVKTPNIDRLAARSVQFNRAYCQYPVCGPSRAAMMSGMYAQAIGVTSNGHSRRFAKNLGARPSMSQLFKRHGYYTARVSKIYHMRVPGDITAGVDGPDHGPSWDERFNCQGPEWMTEGEHEHLSNNRLRRDPDKHYGLGFGTAFYVVKGESAGGEQPDVKAASKAIELIKRQRDKPFFLAVGLVRPHVPLVAPKPFFDPYAPAEMKLPPKKKDDWADIPKAGISRNSKSFGLAGSLEKQRKVLSAYYASVQFMDAQVGRILKALDTAGLRENTIVVFKSDHGYHLGEHDFWQKMSLHEESARIPLLISAPGHKPAKTDSLAEQIDLYPTLAELAGLKVPPHVQGRSLARVLKDPFAEVRAAAYCLKRGGHLMRTKTHAYLRYADGSEELYDMEQDPRQFTNLIRRAEHKEVAQRMRKLLDGKLKAIAGK